MNDPETILKNWNSYLAGEAQTNNKVKPDKVDTEKYGNHCSYVDNGSRIWRFQDKKGYFRFIADYYDDLVIK